MEPARQEPNTYSIQSRTFEERCSDIRDEYDVIRTRFGDSFRYFPLFPPRLRRQRAVFVVNRNPLIHAESTFRTIPPIFRETLEYIIQEMEQTDDDTNIERLSRLATLYYDMYGRPENSPIVNYTSTFTDVVLSVIMETFGFNSITNDVEIYDYSSSSDEEEDNDVPEIASSSTTHRVCAPPPDGFHTPPRSNSPVTPPRLPPYILRRRRAIQRRRTLMLESIRRYTHLVCPVVLGGNSLFRFIPHFQRYEDPAETVPEIIMHTLPVTELVDLYIASLA